MSTITTVIQSLIKSGIRVIKSKTWGSNVETADFVSSGGIDFNPPNNMKGIFVNTGNSSQPVCIGFILKSAIEELDTGELALFSINDSEAIQATLIARKNGDIEINGNSDYMVRYSKLEEAYNQLKSDFDSLVSTFNSHVHPGVLSGGASTAPTITPGSPSTGDITGSKIDNVKTN